MTIASPTRAVSVKDYREACLGLTVAIRRYRDADTREKQLCVRGFLNGWKDVVKSLRCPLADKYLNEHASTLCQVACDHLAEPIIGDN